ncbi:MAG: hypothetical protein R3236_03925 [Phycisphaeraceae bacterium]|nr:hypothetical protein [Phycisphaeraceae bacterium]
MGDLIAGSDNRTPAVRHLVWIAFALLAMAGPSAQAQEGAARKTFDSLFAGEIKKVSSTQDTADDLALARLLFEALQDATGSAELRRIIAMETASLASVDAQGYDLSKQTLDLLQELSPADHLLALKTVAENRNRLFVRSPVADKTTVGRTLVQSWLDYGQALEENGQITAAISAYRKAGSAAAAIRLDRREQIRGLITSASRKRLTYKKIEQAKARLKNNPKDRQTATELVRLYVVELDDPASAQKYTFLLSDEQWKQNVKAAAAPAENLVPADALRLGDWYRSFSTEAEEPQTRWAMANRAVDHYRHYLQNGSPEGLNKLKAELSVKQLEKDLAELAPKVPEADPVTGRWVDLTKHADFSNKFFVRQGKGFLGRESRNRPLVFSVRPEGSYEIRWRFRITQFDEGNASLSVHLPVGKTSVHFYIFRNSKTFGKGHDRLSAYTFIQKHKALDDANPTGVPGSLPMGKDLDVQVRVKVSGQKAALATILNGKTVATWTGPSDQLSPRHGSPTRIPTLSTFRMNIAVAAMQIRMLDGKLVPVKNDGPR